MLPCENEKGSSLSTDAACCFTDDNDNDDSGSVVRGSQCMLT